MTRLAPKALLAALSGESRTPLRSRQRALLRIASSTLGVTLLGLTALAVAAPPQRAPLSEPTVRLVSRRPAAPFDDVSPARPTPAAAKPQASEPKSTAEDIARPAVEDVYRIRPLDEISLDIRPDFPVPEDSAKLLLARRIADPRELRLESGWTPLVFHWAASNFWHRPLYFEDILLERHGQTCGPLLQPVMSGLRFFGTLPILPYKMGIERPLDRVYALGYGRPGNRTHPMRRRLPWELDAALFQAGAVCGIIFLLP